MLDILCETRNESSVVLSLVKILCRLRISEVCYLDCFILVLVLFELFGLAEFKRFSRNFTLLFFIGPYDAVKTKLIEGK